MEKKKNTIKNNLILSILLSFVGYSPFSYAEIKLSLKGNIHSALEIKDDEPNTKNEQIRFGFNARTPKGFTRFLADATRLNEETNHPNALPPAVIEAFGGFHLTEDLSIIMGQQEIAYGLNNKPYYQVLGFDSVNTRMAPQETAGFTVNFTYDKWLWDTGIYNPAYRSSFYNPESVEDSPLISTRLGYQNGTLIYIQGSFAQQGYKSLPSGNDNNTTYIDAIIDVDWSSWWGTFFRYSAVENANGIKGKSETASQFQIDYKYAHNLMFFFRSLEVFDNDIESQLQLFLGGVYQIDKHNKLLINTNLNGNNKDYSGFIGESHPTFFVEHQFNF